VDLDFTHVKEEVLREFAGTPPPAEVPLHPVGGLPAGLRFAY
jgi:sulfonate transport system ATP-binding protein